MWLMSWEHLYIYFSFGWVGFFPLKARSVFVQRGLRVERLCKAVVGGRGLSCLTLVILGLFPTSEEAVGYFLIMFFYFLDPLCDVCTCNMLLYFASPCARALRMCGPSPAAVGRAGAAFAGAAPHGPPLLCPAVPPLSVSLQ